MPKVIETGATPTMSQRNFASAEFALKKKRTRREKFLRRDGTRGAVGAVDRGNRAAVLDERAGGPQTNGRTEDATHG